MSWEVVNPKTSSKFTLFTDPSHGWLKVSDADINELGLTILSFSRYSYYSKGHVYLEEDMDAALFVAAFEAKYGTAPVVRESHSESQIRIRRLERLPEGLSFNRRLEMLAHYRNIIEDRAAA